MSRTLAGSILATVSILLTGASAQKTPALPAGSLPNCRPLDQLVLSCPSLGFTYSLPFGWVDRTDEIQGTIPSAATENPRSAGSGTSQPAPRTSGKTLLAAFERPPGAGGDSINSAVIIAVEDRALYPQVKAAADYFGPLSEIAEGRGLKMDGDPYWFSLGSKTVARADFTGGTEKIPAEQTSLVVLEKSYILSFTFLAGSSDEINNLVASLRFTAGIRKPVSK